MADRTRAVTLRSGQKVHLRVHYPNRVYRLFMPVHLEHFAQIKKQHNGWLVEIREIVSGNLVRYAGTWRALKNAVEEALTIKDI